MTAVDVAPVSSDRDLGEVRRLFQAYAASLDFSLEFQGFDQELADLPGRYAPPAGRLLLARVDGAVAGCVAMRPFDESVCEMKRLFVLPEVHGRGVGRRLANALIDEARSAGYTAMRLDTVPSMRSAIGLYESLGFRDIEPYTKNPIAGTRFLELHLRPTR